MRGLKLLIAVVLVGTPCAALAENGKWDCYLKSLPNITNSIVVSNGKVLRVQQDMKKEVIPDAIDTGDEVVWKEGDLDYTLDVKASTLTIYHPYFNTTIVYDCQRRK